MPFDASGFLPGHGGLVLGIAAAALLVNVPLGWLREGTRKFSPGWFLCVHLSIPLIAGMRIYNHVSNWMIPLFVACAIAGQMAGGRLRRKRGTPPS
jgi:hypothetical protein